MDIHYKGSIQTHMALMATRIAQQEETLTAQQTVISATKEKCNTLAKIVSSQERLVELDPSVTYEHAKCSYEI